MSLDYSRGGGIASSSFVFYLRYIIGYFVCDSASEFGAMGCTSFLRFSYPNLLLVFLNLLFLTTCIIFSLPDFFFFFFSLFSRPQAGLATM